MKYTRLITKPDVMRRTCSNYTNNNVKGQSKIDEMVNCRRKMTLCTKSLSNTNLNCAWCRFCWLKFDLTLSLVTTGYDITLSLVTTGYE